MERFTSKDLRELAGITAPHCISIYMPVYRKGREMQQNPVRLRNLLGQAEEKLRQAGLRGPKVAALLQPATDLLPNEFFWQRQGNGLAMFLSSAGMLHYATSRAFAEQVVWGKRYHLVPLLPLVADDAPFFILSLSLKKIRLIEATRQAAVEREVPGVPHGIEELEQYVDAEPCLQFHTATPPAVGPRKRQAVFHSHGADVDELGVKTREAEYCHLVAEKVQRVLAEETAPLVLACDKALAGLYRKTNRYAHLLDAEVEGNPDYLGNEQLRDAAWPLIETMLAERRRQAIQQYREAEAAGCGSHQLRDVLLAGLDGRIASLLLADNGRCYGQLDEERREVYVHEQPQAGDEDLLNCALSLAARENAALHAIPQEQMPDKAPVAAVFRW
jgi:hypothetical protein